MRDPGFAADRLYATIRGTHPDDLKWERDTYAGALHALAATAKLRGETRPESIGDVFDGVAETSDAVELAELLTEHGSDKATTHDHYVTYAGLLSGRRNETLLLLEIGLGTNNPTVRSNMGAKGTPGASLRAFRDWAPKARVFGADVDEQSLFAEERIATYHVDQTSTDSLASLARRLPEKRFDLIIDDGLHSPWANFNTLNFALPLLATRGAFVVEDVHETYFSAWEIAAALLKPEYNCRLIRGKVAGILLVQEA